MILYPNSTVLEDYLGMGSPQYIAKPSQYPTPNAFNKKIERMGSKS
jgi:hypothetical protein